MPNDSMEAVGHVRVTKTDVKTGEVVFDKVFKNQITDFARGQVAKMWAGTMVNVPQMISVGTGTNASGPQPSDSSLWSEISGARKNVDYATTFLAYYTQYSLTYDQTQALAPTILNFSDTLTGYASAAPTTWTPSGTVTYNSGGATMVTDGASITSTALNNLDPTSVSAVTIQATFKLASASPSSDFIRLWQDSNNYYGVWLTANTLKISKKVAGSTYTLATSSAITLASGSQYTITVSIDLTGAITAKIYAGTTATGTALVTITSTDTSLPGPYSYVVGGDINTVISNAQATYPNPDITYSTPVTEAGLYDSQGNLWSHVQINGVSHDNTTTLSIQWQVLQKGN